MIRFHFLTSPDAHSYTILHRDTNERAIVRVIQSIRGGIFLTHRLLSADSVVYLRGVTKGKAWDLPDSRRSLDQEHCRYVPHISLVQAGGDFGMKSSDPILHTVHMAGAVDYNLPFPMTNVLLTRPMRKSGMVDLKCNAGIFG